MFPCLLWILFLPLARLIIFLLELLPQHALRFSVCALACAASAPRCSSVAVINSPIILKPRLGSGRLRRRARRKWERVDGFCRALREDLPPCWLTPELIMGQLRDVGQQAQSRSDRTFLSTLVTVRALAAFLKGLPESWRQWGGVFMKVSSLQ